MHVRGQTIEIRMKPTEATDTRDALAKVHAPFLILWHPGSHAIVHSGDLRKALRLAGYTDQQGYPKGRHLEFHRRAGHLWV